MNGILSLTLTFLITVISFNIQVLNAREKCKIIEFQGKYIRSDSPSIYVVKIDINVKKEFEKFNEIACVCGVKIRVTRNSFWQESSNKLAAVKVVNIE